MTEEIDDSDAAHPIYLIDRIVVAPGAGEDFLRLYRDEYLPKAEARGIRVATILVHPPLWLDDESNTITAILTVDDVVGWWAAARAGRHDSALAAWWEGVAPLIVDRVREWAADGTELGALARV
ncbi:hypothetical protein [Gordonia sp. (in: high G+C Gram-positive bacteria)]|uniref:hypothetical protein n=1 Tax=Gordonia sp. (in: high G+C Gram-positive bacteria) TaxID=84139 RepID=UPI0016AF9B6B|nr:hypothetical protein [Gordonia sp. (in: high G+C Gram-positive bacteria)]NLG48008.1 hypothetical protein [Gordonia sp. (in: high G+C Gram-positive bacteria)]